MNAPMNILAYICLGVYACSYFYIHTYPCMCLYGYVDSIQWCGNCTIGGIYCLVHYVLIVLLSCLLLQFLCMHWSMEIVPNICSQIASPNLKLNNTNNLTTTLYTKNNICGQTTSPNLKLVNYTTWTIWLPLYIQRISFILSLPPWLKCHRIWSRMSWCTSTPYDFIYHITSYTVLVSRS